MIDTKRHTEARQIHDVRRVALRDYGDMIITQGPEESLSVEADAALSEKIVTEVQDGTLDVRIDAGWLGKIGHALSDLSRSPITYRLTVPMLTGVHIHGAARVRIGPLETDSLSLVLGGAGQISVTGLAASHLQVDLRGAGAIEVAGRATSQDASLGGAGAYKAADLKSHRARVAVVGAGEATVWANEELDAAVRGIGSVRYYGPEAIRTRVTGLGNVVQLGAR